MNCSVDEISPALPAWDGWRYAPNAVSLARLLAAPILLLAVLTRDERLFKWLLLGCLLSDIADGLLARALDARSSLGAFLDSTADVLVCLIAVAGLWAFHSGVLASHRTAFSIVIGLYLAEAGLSLWRYGRISSFHTVLTRVAAYLQGFFVVSLFLWGYFQWLFYAMTVLSAAAYTEELVLLCLLPGWRADVGGLYWIIRGRDRSIP